jgi:SAM-dependent methyltransferase
MPMFWTTLSPEEQRLTEALLTARLYDCGRCGLGFRHPIPSDEQLHELYARLPAERWAADPTKNVAWQDARQRLLQRFPPPATPRVLDVGAFVGGWLQTLPKSWIKAAIEPSATGQAALQSQGIACLSDFLQPPATEQTAVYDAVALFDVFEHLPSPTESLKDAAKYLKPGGWLILSTGNCHHWTWRALGGEQWYCEPVQHVRFGSPAYFRHVAERLSLQLIACEPHAHQQCSWRERGAQQLETWMYAARLQPRWWSPLAKLLLRVPGLGYLKHKTAGPYAPGLSDHLLVVYEKPGA